MTMRLNLLIAISLTVIFTSATDRIYAQSQPVNYKPQSQSVNAPPYDPSKPDRVATFSLPSSPKSTSVKVRW